MYRKSKNVYMFFRSRNKFINWYNTKSKAYTITQEYEQKRAKLLDRLQSNPFDRCTAEKLDLLDKEYREKILDYI